MSKWSLTIAIVILLLCSSAVLLPEVHSQQNANESGPELAVGKKYKGFFGEGAVGFTVVGKPTGNWVKVKIGQFMSLNSFNGKPGWVNVQGFHTIIED